MRALVLLDNGAGTNNNNPGDSLAKLAINACYSMGIDVTLFKVYAAGTPSAANMATMVADVGADMIVIPTGGSGGTAAYWDDYTFAVTTIGVPIFQLCWNNQSNVNTKGLINTTATYPGDTGTTAALATITRTGGTISSYGKRVLLSTSLVAPEVVTPLVIGQGADTTAVSAWKWTPNGTHYVYYHILYSNLNLLHLLIDEAIRDGALEAPPIKAPHFLSIDHFDGDGENVTYGGTGYTSGTVGQPQIISTLGDILRSVPGAVCYASISEADTTPSPAVSQAIIDTQNAKFVEYADVFRYIASHNHLHELASGTATDSAIDSQLSKADINTLTYGNNLTAIANRGLTVSTDLMHFATDRVGTNFYELAQRGTHLTCDPADTTPRAGYGCRVARIAGGNSANVYSYPSMRIDGWHWLRHTTKFRGIVCISSLDSGDQIQGAVSDSTQDYKAFRENIMSHCRNAIGYFHENDFEDETLNPDGLNSNGQAKCRGTLSWQMGAAYASACPNTVQWGARADRYVL